MVFSSKAQKRKIKSQLGRHSSAILKTMIDMGRWSHENAIVEVIEEILMERHDETHWMGAGAFRKVEAVLPGNFLR